MLANTGINFLYSEHARSHPLLTDAEYDLLLLRHIPSARGRPPADRRRTLDAIFHVVMARCIWAELPAHLGKPDAAQRQLRRWMRAGVMDALLRAAATPAYASLRLRICRAWRRAARIATMRSLLLAKDLRMQEALPCAPIHLPKPLLSEYVQKLTFRLMENPCRVPYRVFGLCGRLMRFAGGRPDLWRTQ
ncbi:MAG: family transposase [Rubritepida sp.]|nr:family transposase [Rubritepida sp.]